MMGNIKDAKRVRDAGGFDCGLYASYIHYDGDQGKRMEAAVEEIRPYVDEIYGLPLYSQAGLVTDKEEKQGWKPTSGNMGRLDNLREPLPCWANFTEGHITYDGKLGNCCFSFIPEMDMGDLNTTSFMDAWHSQKFQAIRAANLRRDVRGTVCEKCVAY
jgi:radical SAM protein with 4Fe4S-binding SPASM domain